MLTSAIVREGLIGILRKLRVDEIELERRQPFGGKGLVMDTTFNQMKKKSYAQSTHLPTISDEQLPEKCTTLLRLRRSELEACAIAICNRSV